MATPASTAANELGKLLMVPSPIRLTIVPPKASWWASSALMYLSRLSSPRRSSACISAVYPTMSVNIKATS
jgi:hypothetical protein